MFFSKNDKLLAENLKKSLQEVLHQHREMPVSDVVLLKINDLVDFIEKVETTPTVFRVSVTEGIEELPRQEESSYDLLAGSSFEGVFSEYKYFSNLEAAKEEAIRCFRSTQEILALRVSQARDKLSVAVVTRDKFREWNAPVLRCKLLDGSCERILLDE